jgi:hypothetical protein
MDYSRWGDCPPRAPIGKQDAVYATHDHFILLLGRIADFAARDRARKIKVMEANGGQWRPDAAFMRQMMSAKGSQSGSSPATPMGPPPGFPMGPPSQGFGMGPAPVAHSIPQSPSFSPAPPGAYPMGPQIAASMLGANPNVQNPLMSPISPQMGVPQGVHGGQPFVLQPNQNAVSFATGPPPSPVAPQIPFYGMAPSMGRAHMPSSYSRGVKSDSPETTLPEVMDLETATRAALEEWTQINAALHAFASNLGPAFQPLSAEYHQPLVTPFGDARHYRSYDISNVWALFYMAKIITMRSHPSMPPAAMMAAGVAASQTAELANEIGRIAAGIVPPPSNIPLNPSLGAALISSTMPLFFAGVQYTDAEQRAWLVPRILDIEKRTGFGSAGLIARGCEIAWEKMGQAGRGPPYRMYRQPEDEDQRLNGNVVELGSDGLEGNSPQTRRREIPEGDRSHIFTKEAARVHWAFGLLGEGKDLEMQGRLDGS